MTDTSKTIEIKKSPEKLLGLFLAGVLMIGLAYWVANGGAVDSRRGGPWTIPLGWFGVVFFGLCLLVLIKDLFVLPQTVLSLSPSGLRDLRLCPDEVAWTNVRAVSEFETYRNKFVMVSIDANVESQMKFNWRFRLTRRATTWIGADGLWLSPSGLETNFNDLFYDILAYARA